MFAFADPKHTNKHKHTAVHWTVLLFVPQSVFFFSPSSFFCGERGKCKFSSPMHAVLLFSSLSFTHTHARTRTQTNTLLHDQLHNRNLAHAPLLSSATHMPNHPSSASSSTSSSSTTTPTAENDSHLLFRFQSTVAFVHCLIVCMQRMGTHIHHPDHTNISSTHTQQTKPTNLTCVVAFLPSPSTFWCSWSFVFVFVFLFFFFFHLSSLAALACW